MRRKALLYSKRHDFLTRSDKQSDALKHSSLAVHPNHTFSDDPTPLPDMIGRLFRIFFFFALAALIINRLFSRKQKRALRDVAKISAWVLLGAAAATLFWYLVMLYFKHIPNSY